MKWYLINIALSDIYIKSIKEQGNFILYQEFYNVEEKKFEKVDTEIAIPKTLIIRELNQSEYNSLNIKHFAMNFSRNQKVIYKGDATDNPFAIWGNEYAVESSNGDEVSLLELENKGVSTVKIYNLIPIEEKSSVSEVFHSPITTSCNLIRKNPSKLIPQVKTLKTI